MTTLKNIKLPVLFLLLIAAVIMASGCKKVTYYQLSDADMSWLVYQNNEVDTFMNGTTMVKYLVTIRTKSYYDNSDASYEFTTAQFKQLNDTAAYYYKDSEGKLYIYKPDDSGLLVTLTWPHFPPQSVPLTNMVPSAANIGGVNYSDVYVINATGFTDARYYISKVWYSKAFGCVQYEDRDGEVWIKK